MLERNCSAIYQHLRHCDLRGAVGRVGHRIRRQSGVAGLGL